MKKAIFLVLFTALGLFTPVFLGAMDRPSNNNFKKASVTPKLEEFKVIATLKKCIFFYKISKLAKEQLEAIKVYKKHAHPVKLFQRILVEMKVPKTAKLLQDPMCQAMLLQCRSVSSIEDSVAFNQGCLKITKTFDHPLINNISLGLEAYDKIDKIFREDRRLWEENGEKNCAELIFTDEIGEYCETLTFTDAIYDYYKIHNKIYYNQGNVNIDLIFDLQNWITIYENNQIPFIDGFNELINQLPSDQAEQFKNAFISDEELSLINAEVKKNLEESNKDYIPKVTRDFETKKKANQQKYPNKKKRKKRSRKKKRSRAVGLSSIEKKQENVPTITSTTNIIKSPQEPLTQKQLKQRQLIQKRLIQKQLIQKLQFYYPGVEKIALFPHMVQFTDRITRRSFTLYNATGNTDYLRLSKFEQLAKLPKVHGRVSRWDKDIDTAIEQVQNETGKRITRDARKDWIRKHQLPVALLYHFRGMGHKKIFIDDEGNEITCLYLVGRLEDRGYRGYKRDGYFGLGFLPGEKKEKPTIYHACFEPKSFMAIMRDKELTAEQKKNLLQAFKLKDTSYD